MAQYLQPLQPYFSLAVTATSVSQRIALPAMSVQPPYQMVYKYLDGTVPAYIAFGDASVVAGIATTVWAPDCHLIALSEIGTYSIPPAATYLAWISGGSDVDLAFTIGVGQ